MEKLVHILMSTYNGAEHIQRQIDSILGQTYENFCLYVRDDGSKDNTVEIVEAYATKDKRVVLVDDGLGNLGVPDSFYQLALDVPEADYYAFADQDDIWNPEKLEWAVDRLEAKKIQILAEGKKWESTPLLYTSSYDYVDMDGKFIRKFPKQKMPVKFDHVLYYSIASGFTMVFNDALRVLSIPTEFEEQDGGSRIFKYELQDRRLQRVAAAFGSIVVDNRSTAKHIRYDDSVTGDDSTNANLFKRFIQQEILGDSMLEEKIFLRDFMKQYGAGLNPKDYKTLMLFSSNRRNPVVQLAKVFYPHRLRTRLGGEIALRLMFLLGRI